MFDSLSERLELTIKNLRGRGRLTEENIDDTLRQVRVALLEADVALSVVKDFIAQVRQRAIGKTAMNSLSPGQTTIKIVEQELSSLMGEENVPLNLKTRPPAVILMVGLQGVGKTTSVAKLGHYLQTQQRKTVLVTSCDIYRPSAIEQLETIANETKLEFFPSQSEQKPQTIAENALLHAQRCNFDVLIVDTAGRLHVDDDMMQEIKHLYDILQPVETLFVVDSMMGQDAVNSATMFNSRLSFTGVILTKTDGDSRGGAVLSVRYVTGKPIKFIGTGEKNTDLQPFHPQRIAQRILGMGDVLGLIEQVSEKADQNRAEKMAKKLKKGHFTLEDFLEQLQQMRSMGGIASLMDKLPGGFKPQTQTTDRDQQFVKFETVINSMTLLEKRTPKIINGSRKKRIAAGSGTQIQEVNRLLKQFAQMQKMMKRFAKGGMKKFMRSMPGGRMPF